MPGFLSEMEALALIIFPSQTRLKTFIKLLANKVAPSGLGVTYFYQGVYQELYSCVSRTLHC